MSKKGSALLKQVINKLDSNFTLAKVDDADKLHYQDGYSKIKRECEESLRCFKTFIDLEENTKFALAHANTLKH